MLESQYEQTETIENFEEIIRVTRQTIQIIFDDQFDFAKKLNNLKIKLESRYERTKTIKDFEKVIRVAQQIIQIIFNDHSDFAV